MKLLKYFLAALVLAACLAPSAGAQTITNVTGTILDPENIPYAGAAVTITLQAPSGGASPFVTATNSPVIMPVGVFTNSAGVMSTFLVANASITPASTTYTFRFCTPVIPPPLGTGNSCFSIAGVTVAGASQDISCPCALAVQPLTNLTVQSRVFNTAPAAGTASIGATPMVTAPAQPAAGTHYNLSSYVTQTVLGASCAGNSTIVINAIFQDPNAAAPQTTPIATYTVTTNGTLGIVPLTANAYAGAISFIAKPGTVVQYSTTYTPGGSCAPAPQAQFFPALELQ